MTQYSQIWLHSYSFIREVHNVSQRRQRRTKPRPQDSLTCRKIGEYKTCSSGEMLADRQTDKVDKHTQTRSFKYFAALTAGEIIMFMLTAIFVTRGIFSLNFYNVPFSSDWLNSRWTTDGNQRCIISWLFLMGRGLVKGSFRWLLA